MQVEVKGLDEFAKELRRIDPRLAKALSKGHKEIASDVAAKAQRKVTGLRSPRSGRAATGVRARATAKNATIVLLGSNPVVRAAVMGAEVHWVFGRPIRQSSMLRRVWQPWVGNDWTAEEGLYGVSPAIREAIPGVIETYAERISEALAAAFPD